MSIVLLETAGAFDWEPICYFDSMEQAIKWVEESYDISYDEDELDLYDWCSENGIKLTEVKKFDDIRY
jgi:hypothetical protein